MQVDASCKQMITTSTCNDANCEIFASEQLRRIGWIPFSGSCCWYCDLLSLEVLARRPISRPGKVVDLGCGNASVGKKKVEKLRLIQGISNSKRKSVYRGIILKSQEELVNVRVFNDSWNANNTPAYSLVQTQSLMLWTVLINGILSHEETDMRPFRLPMLSQTPSEEI